MCRIYVTIAARYDTNGEPINDLAGVYIKLSNGTKVEQAKGIKAENVSKLLNKRAKQMPSKAKLGKAT